MSTPLVGIALAAYKPNVEYFQQQLQSITDQTYDNWFCIIGFDSPISDLREESSLQPFFKDSRFEFIQNPSTLGLVGNFEATGLACLARNPKYIAYSDQDDIWYETKVTKLVAALESRPALSVVHCDMHILMKQEDDSFKTLEQTAWQVERRGVHHVSPLDFFIRNIAAGAGMLIDADLIRRYPHIPGDAYGQDHWYPMTASFFGGVYPLNEPLYGYRIHGANVAGLAPYRSFFGASTSSKKLGVIHKCLVAFKSSRARFTYAEKAGLPVTPIQKLITRSRTDLGFGYLVKALSVIARDRALARACIARAAGKILGVLKPNSINAPCRRLLGVNPRAKQSPNTITNESSREGRIRVEIKKGEPQKH